MKTFILLSLKRLTHIHEYFTRAIIQFKENELYQSEATA